MLKHLVIDLDKKKIVKAFGLGVGSRLKLCLGMSVIAKGCTIESRLSRRYIFINPSQNEKIPEIPQEAIQNVRFEWWPESPNYPNGIGSTKQTNVHISTLDDEQHIIIQGTDIKSVLGVLNLFNTGQTPEKWVPKSARVSKREILPEFCCKYHQRKYYEEEF